MTAVDAGGTLPTDTEGWQPLGGRPSPGLWDHASPPEQGAPGALGKGHSLRLGCIARMNKT